jgi:hypothetical protein
MLACVEMLVYELMPNMKFSIEPKIGWRWREHVLDHVVNKVCR